MNVFGFDITSIPWPLFLTGFMVVGFAFWFMFVYLPLLEEHEKLKEELKQKVELLFYKFQEFDPSEFNYVKEKINKIIDQDINIIDKLTHLASMQSDKFEDITHMFDEHERIEINKFDDQKHRMQSIQDKIDNMKEKLLLLENTLTNTSSKFKE